MGIDDDLPERFWAEGDFPLAEDGVTDPTARLVSLSFVTAALRRRARLWITLAVVGLVLGAAMYEVKPPAAQATATILLKDGPNEDPQVQITSDGALAKSTQVAQDVISELKLDQTVASFLTSYSVGLAADQVLTITASAKSPADAATQANAIAAAFLQVRANYAQIQEKQLEAGLQQQVTDAQNKLNAVNKQVADLATAIPAPSSATITNLQNEQKSLQTTYDEIQSAELGTVVTDRAGTQTMIQGSQVITSALPVKKSALKGGAGLFFGGGLFGGLLLGMAIVVIGALLSNRLRSRDDVAYALGVPVKTSVGPLRAGRLPSFGRAKNRDRDMRRLVDHLRHAVPGKGRGEPAGLAVVAVDDPQTVGEAVATLATDYASQGKRVVVADLSSGGHVAQRLGAAKTTGIQRVEPGGVRLVVVVPDSGEPMPVGPLTSNASPVRFRRASAELTAVASDADVLLSLVTLDPALGAEHVATWATDAVPVVTAARSSAVAIRSVGEMLRIAGTRVESAVLIDADENDETLGAWGPIAN